MERSFDHNLEALKSREVEMFDDLKLKFDFLDTKVRLIEAASKLNDLDFYGKSKNNLVKVFAKYSYYKNRFDKQWTTDLDKLNQVFEDINSILENIIEDIEEVDCIKRDDESYCRIGINYGREYIEKGLISKFGYNVSI